MDAVLDIYEEEEEEEEEEDDCMDELIDSKLAMSSSRVDRGKSIEVNESPKSLKERLSNCQQSLRPPFIYRVPRVYVRDSYDNAHEPHMVAIGPYHHGKRSLKMMEEQKLIYLQSLLLRKKESVDTYISAIAEIEEAARSCYAEELNFSKDEFIEMLVLDGCFIIELSRKSWIWYYEGDSSCTSDLIFQKNWWFLSDVITDDLILFENQIPFFVLCKLFGLINKEVPIPNQQQLLMKWIFNLLALVGGDNVITDEVMHLLDLKHEVMHLLDLKHATEWPSSRIYNILKLNPDFRPFGWEFRRIPSATELKDANVTFRNTSRSPPFTLGFSNGVLTMSTQIIHDQMDRDMRNLILYEQYFLINKSTHVTDYVVLLDCLINTGQDVEILSQCGIIKNVTGHYQEAADIINRLAQSVRASRFHFIYANTFSEINAYHKKPCNTARATLRRDYFNTPWAYISFVAALLLLLLTVAQTIFSAIQL